MIKIKTTKVAREILADLTACNADRDEVDGTVDLTDVVSGINEYRYCEDEEYGENMLDWFMRQNWEA